MTWGGEDVWSTVKSTAQVSSSGLLSERRKTPETPIRQFGQKGDGETEGEGHTDRQTDGQTDRQTDNKTVLTSFAAHKCFTCCSKEYRDNFNSPLWLSWILS